MTAILDDPRTPRRPASRPGPTRPQPAPPAPRSRTVVGWVGVLLGLAAAVPGVPPLLPMFGIRPWHMLVAAALVLALVRCARGTASNLRISGLDVALAVYVVAAALVEYTNAGDLGFAFDALGAVTPLFYVVGYLAARLIIASRDDARVFLTAFALPAFPVGVLSVLQLGSPSFSLLVLKIAPGPGLSERIVDGRLIRATGLVGHWTGLGFYFCTALAAACAALLLVAPGRKRLTLPLTVGLAGSAFGALSSLTISVLATVCLIGLVTLIVVGIRVGRVLALGAVALVLYLQFGDYLGERFTQQSAYRPEYLPAWVPNTIAYRWKIWTEQTIPVIADRPWTGWGTSLYTGTWRPRGLVWGSPESQWFGMAIASGIVVTVLFGVVLLAALVFAMSGIRSTAGRWKAPIATLLVAAIIASLTVPAFTNRGLPIGLWVLFGVILAVRDASHRAKASAT